MRWFCLGFLVVVAIVVVAYLGLAGPSWGGYAWFW